jgi:hypothetical protein
MPGPGCTPETTTGARSTTAACPAAAGGAGCALIPAAHSIAMLTATVVLAHAALAMLPCL